MNNWEQCKRFAKISLKYAIYGAVICAIIGAVGCQILTINSNRDSTEAFFGGLAIGGVGGACAGAAIPLTISTWFLLLVMINQFSNAIVSDRSKNLNVNLKMQDDKKED